METRSTRKISTDTMDRAYTIDQRLIPPILESQNFGRIVSIDADANVEDSVLPASLRLRVREPNTRIGTIRIGVGPVHRLGYVSVRELSYPRPPRS